MNTGDKYTDIAWDKIPEGPKKNMPWSALKVCTLRSILKADKEGYIKLDYRRVAEIQKALEGKGCGDKGKVKSDG